MKYVMMSYTLARGGWGTDCNIRELCKFTSELGIPGVDWVTTYNSSASEVKQVMDEYGLITACYTFFADLNFPDATGRMAGLDDVKKGVEAAVTLGTDKIMLPFPGKEGVSRKESQRNVIEGLKDVMKIADAAGIVVSVEHFSQNHAPFVISSDVNAAIREVPDLKVTFDNGNVQTGGQNPSEGFMDSKDAIVHAHFKDYTSVAENEGMHGLGGGYYKAALIGEGIVDYPALLATMKDANYQGYIDIEYEGDEYMPEDAVRKALRYLRDVEESLA